MLKRSWVVGSWWSIGIVFGSLVYRWHASLGCRGMAGSRLLNLLPVPYPLLISLQLLAGLQWGLSVACMPSRLRIRLLTLALAFSYFIYDPIAVSQILNLLPTLLILLIFLQISTASSTIKPLPTRPSISKAFRRRKGCGSWPCPCDNILDLRLWMIDEGWGCWRCLKTGK